jgi:hypothetical protein
LTFTAVQFLAFLAAVLLLLPVIWHRPGWVAFAAISGAVLLDCFEVGTAGASMGVNLYTDDAACVLLLLTGFVMLLRYRRALGRDLVPCLILLALVALNFSRGVNAFGVKPAGNGARNLFMFTAPALTLMLLRLIIPLSPARLARWFAWAGCALCLIAILRWAGILPMPVGLEDNLREVVRTLPSDYAIVVGQAFIAVIYLQIAERTTNWWWAVSGMLGIVTIFLQHRSVWVATAAGLGWLAVRTAQSSTLRWLSLAAVGVVALGLVIIVDPNSATTVQSLISVNAQEVQSQDSSWQWRVQGFTEATDRVFAGDATDMLIGPPAGWAAKTDASFASTHIHDRYVDTLAYYGVFGLAVLLVWLGMLAKRTFQSRRPPATKRLSHDAGSTFLQALLVSQIVYLVPYFGGILQGTVLGLLWVAATQGAKQKRSGRAATVYARVLCTSNVPVEVS